VTDFMQIIILGIGGVLVPILGRARSAEFRRWFIDWPFQVFCRSITARSLACLLASYGRHH
jgi:hypothetical protein